MFRANTKANKKGFTLVELLVVTPIALLVIVGFVALMVVMVGDVIASRTYNTMTYEIQNALDTIERDVRLSTEFQTSSGELPSPQGKDGNESPFISTAGDLVLGAIATDKNPLDPTRRFVHYDTPFECSSEHRYKNRVFFTSVIYFVRDNSLWRRSYVPNYTPGNMCSTPWQVNTCSPDYTSGQTQCQSTDSEVLKNIKDFSVTYHTNPEDTVEISSASASSASTISVSIELEDRAAGRTVSAASSSRATKLSSREVNLAPPDAPDVTGSVSGTDAVFSWPGVPTATSYIINYNINGGSWITASENSTETTFSLPANHGDTVSVEIMARNTTGASAKATATAEIPLWIGCSLHNNWNDFAGRNCGFTKTKDGVVMIKGMIRDGERNGNTKLLELPPGYRPPRDLIFSGSLNGLNSIRLQVNTDGSLWLIGSTGSPGWVGWLALGDIYFLGGDGGNTWSDLPLLNGWQNYGTLHGSSRWRPLASARDGSGRVHISGLIVPGTYSIHTPISSLPADIRSSEYHMFPARGGSDFHQVGTSEATRSALMARGGSNPGGFLSVRIMYYPQSFTGWTNFGTTSGAPSNGQIGNGWVTYGGVYATPAYTKSDDGIVTLKGLIRNGPTTSGTVVAQLPPGYRPGQTVRITTVSNGTYAAVDITSGGQVNLLRGDTTWFSLAPISFIAEN